jgi:hypothetical protein
MGRLAKKVPSRPRVPGTSAPVGLADIRLLQGAPGEPGSGPHRYLLQAELQAPVVHDDIEELHHIRLQRRRRYSLAADTCRVATTR